MWEIIEANKRKSFFLLIGMGFCLITLGYALGEAFFPPEGGILGIALASSIWFIMSLVSFFSGDQILLSVSRAKEVTREIHPQLFNIVEEMKIAAHLPAMPRIFIMDEEAPNAFATGRKPERSAVAVTTGLLSRLNRDELQGVIAHEMSHILNRDILFMTLAGIMLGSIVLISDTFLRVRIRSSGSSPRYRARSSGSGQAQAIMFLVALLLLILAPIAARLLYFALSRRREYLADASGARLTRYPEGLASALQKIADSAVELPTANRVTAPMYIVNPFGARSMGFSGFLSTHPPVRERIQILRSMAGGASYASYQNAFASVMGRHVPIIPPSGLKDASEISVRKPSVEEAKKQDAKSKARGLGDLTRVLNQFAFLTCVCGLRIKVPPDFKQPKIVCPKCLTSLQNPFQGRVQGGENLPQEYVRQSHNWESFSCRCGKLIQLSPAFSGSNVECTNCGQKILIENALAVPS